MTDENDTTDTTRMSVPGATPPGSMPPELSPPLRPYEPEGIAFHEPVRATAGRSLHVRIGIVAGSALLMLVGVAAAMGASPAPSTSADPAASGSPEASTAPEATAAPETTTAPESTTAPNSNTAPDPNQKDAVRGPKDFLFGFGRGGPGFPGMGAISITAIDGSNVSLKTDDGWSRTITVTSATTITKGGATIAVGDLQVGDHVRIGQERAADGTYTVTHIVVVLPAVAGQVSAIDGNTITITQPGGTTATVHVDSGTTYQVNGAAGTLSDVKVGSFIVAEGTQRADGSLDASVVRTGDHGGPGRPGGHGHPDGGGVPKAPAASPAPTSGAS